MADQNQRKAIQGSTTYTQPSDERVVCCLIFFVCLGYLCLMRNYSSLEPDEGILLQGAERILGGQIPYRDFFTFYTPGSFYLVAALFKIFGDSFHVARASIAVVGATCSVISYLLARRICNRQLAVLVAVLATTAGTGFRFLVLHNVYSTLACCLCAYAAVRFSEDRKSQWAFTMTSLVSLTFLIEQSRGGGLFAGLLLAFIIMGVASRSLLPSRRSQLIMGAGFLWPLVLVFAYFGYHRSATLMLQSWLWPFQHYTRANHVPYGYQNWSERAREAVFYSGPIWLRVFKALVVSPLFLVPILPFIAVGVMAYWILRFRNFPERGEVAPFVYYVILCSIFTGLLISVVIVRADVLHFMYLAPLWYLVFAWILRRSTVPWLERCRVISLGWVMISFSLLSLAVVFAAMGAPKRIDTIRGTITTGAKETVLDYVQKHVAPKSALLVYPYLPLYNYLSGTQSPATLDYFQPGMNTPEQAQEIISSLHGSDAPVLLETKFNDKIARSWPGTPALSADPVFEYLSGRYHTCKLLSSPEGWEFQFMVRNERPCD